MIYYVRLKLHFLPYCTMCWYIFHLSIAIFYAVNWKELAARLSLTPSLSSRMLFFIPLLLTRSQMLNSSSHYTRDISPGAIQFFASLMNHHNQDLCIINNRTPPVNFREPFGMCLSIEWKYFMYERWLHAWRIYQIMISYKFC